MLDKPKTNVKVLIDLQLQEAIMQSSMGKWQHCRFGCSVMPRDRIQTEATVHLDYCCSHETVLETCPTKLIIVENGRTSRVAVFMGTQRAGDPITEAIMSEWCGKCEFFIAK